MFISGSVQFPPILCLTEPGCVQVKATPSDFDTYGLCGVPAKRYGHHGRPVQNELVTFTLEDSAGQLVTAWSPGEQYTLTTASASSMSMQAFVHTSMGTFDLTEDPTGPVAGFIAAACTSAQAWGSYRSKAQHSMLWRAPEAVSDEGQCAVFSGVQAASERDAYQTNTVRLPSKSFTLHRSHPPLTALLSQSGIQSTGPKVGDGTCRKSE